MWNTFRFSLVINLVLLTFGIPSIADPIDMKEYLRVVESSMDSKDSRITNLELDSQGRIKKVDYGEPLTFYFKYFPDTGEIRGITVDHTTNYIDDDDVKIENEALYRKLLEKILKDMTSFDPDRVERVLNESLNGTIESTPANKLSFNAEGQLSYIEFGSVFSVSLSSASGQPEVRYIDYMGGEPELDKEEFTIKNRSIFRPTVPKLYNRASELLATFNPVKASLQTWHFEFGESFQVNFDLVGSDIFVHGLHHPRFGDMTNRILSVEKLGESFVMEFRSPFLFKRKNIVEIDMSKKMILFDGKPVGFNFGFGFDQKPSPSRMFHADVSTAYSVFDKRQVPKKEYMDFLAHHRFLLNNGSCSKSAN